MKRASLLLILTLVALYAGVTYEVWTKDAYPASSPKGYLSDIAQSVTAIPLQSAGKCEIKKPRSIRKEGNDLFLISKDILYRFNTVGQFVCQITQPAIIQVATYIIDPYGDDRIAFPLRFGRRFWFASSYDPNDASRTYAFCFDRETNRSWQMEGGFEDDFYHTGFIPEWQAMDILSRAYSFCKSGEAVKHISPSGEPVVFIVELKG